MKKIVLILLLAFSVLGLKAQTTYQLNYDSIRVNKTAGTGGTSLYGKVYLKNVSVGFSTDSGLVVRNGRVFKYPITPALSFGTFGSTANAQGGSYSAGVITLQPASASFPGGVTTSAQGFTGLKTFNTASGTNAFNLNKTSNDVGILGLQVSAVDKSFIEWNVNDGGSGVGTAFNIRNGQGALGLYDSSNTGLKISGGNAVFAGSGSFNNHLINAVDNTYDFGASGATRFRTGYFGTSVIAPSFYSTSNVGFGTSSPQSTANYTFATTDNTTTGGGLMMRSNTVNKAAVYNTTTGLWLEGGDITIGNSGFVASNAVIIVPSTKLTTLAGTGTRMVVANNVGTLSTQAIPGGGGGGVTGVAVATANGLAGTSDGAAVVPTLTLTTSVNGMVKGNGTALSAATAGTDYTSPTGTENLSNKTITGSTISGYMPTTGGTFAGQVGINVGTSSVSDFDQLFLVNGGENGANILFNNTFGNLAGITGTKMGTGGSADEGKLIFKTANASVLSTGMTLNNSGNLAVVGAITGSNLSGTNTGDQTTITGNAGTATALQTARTISGTSFDGTANITLNNTGITNGAGYITSSALTPYALTSSLGTAAFTASTAYRPSSYVPSWTEVTSKPTFSSVATSGAYGDLSGTPNLALYAPLANPTFTGTVSGITAAMVGSPSGSGTSSGTNTGDQTIALTGAVTGSGTGSFATTLASGVDATKIADGTVTSAEFQYINTLSSNAQTQIDAKAPLASPALTGSPTAPTQTAGDNSTKIATTAYVDAATSSASNIQTFSLNGDGVTTSFNTGVVAETSITPANLIIGSPILMPSPIAWTFSKVSMGGGTFNWYVVFATPPASGTSNITFTYQLD